MKLLEIVSNGYNVLNSGSVFTFKQNDLEFSLNPFKIVISFLNDDNVSGVQTEIIDNNIFKIKLYNYNSSLGMGISEPIYVGTIAGKAVYLDFIVYSLTKDSSKNFNYTFFEEK